MEGRLGGLGRSTAQIENPGRGEGISEARLGRGARVVVRVVALLGLLTFSFMLVFVLSDAVAPRNAGALSPPGSIEARIGAEHPAETVHIAGALVALAVGATGLIGLIISPMRAGSANQTAAAALAMVLATVLVGNPDNYGGQAGAVDPTFLVMAIPPLAAAITARPWRLWKDSGDFRSLYIVFAVVALPAIWFAVQQGLMQRYTWPPDADPHHQAHWYAMSVAALAVIFVLAAAALPGRGWRLSAITGGVGATLIGVASLIDTDAASALHPVIAGLALAWGIGVLVVTLRMRGKPAIQHQSSDDLGS